jgi:4-hydroxy-tetrahydrodipicolinate synthase
MKVNSTPVLGHVLTAMVTPFDERGDVDLKAAQTLARHLTRPGWNDGLVLNGTTGESTTTSDEEKHELVAAVRAAVDARVQVIAGVGSADTQHSVAMARAAEGAGADGLLVVAPYYSRPTQLGILRHFETIADATNLPVMLYNIPKRTGVEVSPDTLVAAGEHERIVAVKDATGDLGAASDVLGRSALDYYSGEDLLNLPSLSVGFVGFVSVIGHVVGDRLRDLLTTVQAGDLHEARRIHQQLLPLSVGMFRAPGAASAKAALDHLGLPGGGLRPPLGRLTSAERELLVADLELTGVTGTPASA